MAKIVKSVKEKLGNGTFSNPIPFGIDGNNVDLANGYNLEQALGTIKVNDKGTVQKQLDDLGISVGKKIDASKVYTKTEIDTKLSDYYTSSQINTKLGSYATNSSVDTKLNNYYKKTEIDTKLTDYATTSSLSNYYTKTESNTKYALKASLNNYYAKSEIYTKTEVDGLLTNRFEWVKVSTW